MALKYCEIEVAATPDGSWRAEAYDLGGISVDPDRERAIVVAQALALRQLADRMDRGPGPALTAVIFHGDGLPTIEQELEAEDAEDAAIARERWAEMKRTGDKGRPWEEVKAEIEKAD